MCSICGEVSFSFSDLLNENVIDKMNKTLKHRGPDESDVFKDKYAILVDNTTKNITDDCFIYQPKLVGVVQNLHSYNESDDLYEKSTDDGMIIWQTRFHYGGTYSKQA